MLSLLESWPFDETLNASRNLSDGGGYRSGLGSTSIVVEPGREGRRSGSEIQLFPEPARVELETFLERFGESGSRYRSVSPFSWRRGSGGGGRISTRGGGEGDRPRSLCDRFSYECVGQLDDDAYPRWSRAIISDRLSPWLCHMRRPGMRIRNPR